MQSTLLLSSIPDGELLHRLADLLRSSRHTEADLVAHIGEVEARRLYAREAAPSMWAYCTERLHLSGAEAYLRIAAARVSRDHPVVLEMLADGRLHLTAIALLAPHLTAANRESLLRRATHRSKREIEELLAEMTPWPVHRERPGPRTRTRLFRLYFVQTKLFRADWTRSLQVRVAWGESPLAGRRSSLCLPLATRSSSQLQPSCARSSSDCRL
jgi:hypothetical protein